MVLLNAFVSVVLEFSTELTLNVFVSPGHGLCECVLLKDEDRIH